MLYLDANNTYGNAMTRWHIMIKIQIIKQQSMFDLNMSSRN